MMETRQEQTCGTAYQEKLHLARITDEHLLHPIGPQLPSGWTFKVHLGASPDGDLAPDFIIDTSMLLRVKA